MLHNLQRKTLDQLDKDDQIKPLDNKNKKITKTGNKGSPIKPFSHQTCRLDVAKTNAYSPK
jgi:hypothetical protein